VSTSVPSTSRIAAGGTSLRISARTGQETSAAGASVASVRTLFVFWNLLIASGLVYFSVIGLSHH